MIKRNLGRALALSAAAMLALTACGGESDAQDMKEGEAGLTKITIATVGSDSGSQAFYAENQGFFEKQGLDVTVSIVANVPELAAAVESGDAEFALTSPTSIASAFAAGLDFKIVAGGAIYSKDNPGVWVMLPTNSDVSDTQQLAGKTVAVNALNTMPHLSTLATLDDAGVDIAKVDFVTLGFAEVGQALESNQIDAATVTAPFNYQIESDGIGSTLLSPYDAVNDGKDFYNTIWFGSDKYIKANPEVVRKFQAAFKETNAWANDPANQEERKLILQKNTSLTDATLKDMQLLQFGDEVTEVMIQPVIDIMDRFKVLPKPVKTTDIIANLN